MSRDTKETARELLECAEGWEPDVRLVGNVRAEDIAALCRTIVNPVLDQLDQMAVARRQRFMKALSKFLSGDTARKSVELEMGGPWAKEWAEVRNAAPMLGWATEEETYTMLCQFLGVKV